MYALLSQLNKNQIQNMLDTLQSSLLAEHPSSIPFALLLDFKCKIIDCLLMNWPLEEFRGLLYLFHPMECVCKFFSLHFPKKIVKKQK